MSITAANATFLLGVPGVYPSAVQLQGFGADDAFTNAAVAVAEARVGVDGYGTGGYVPRMVPMTIKLLPDSISIAIFENYIRYLDTIGDVVFAFGQIIMPSVKLQYSMPKGLLMDVQTAADVRRVLADREFRFTWLPQGPQMPAVTSSPT